MKTEHRLAEALKIMMAEKPIDEISVLSLTKKCKVNRQTFYYYFHDIYDLLALVFLDEKINGIEKTTTYKEMVKCIYSYYEKNKKFIEATLSSGGKELFFEFVYNACYQCSMRFINAIKDGKSLHLNEKKVIARFYASAYSNSILYYISNYKHKTLAGMEFCFSFCNDDELQKVVEHFIKTRD